MPRALDAAVSGLKAHQLKMDVIANNVANINTVAFKKSKVEFSDILYQKMRSASAPVDDRGGTNPQMIGLGVKIGSINTDFAQGVLTSTGRNLDLAIQGEGFFVVTDGSSYYYTRNGNFDVSPLDNSLCLSNGMKLLGYGVDNQGRIDITRLVPISVPVSKGIAARQTTNVVVTNNIDAKTNINEPIDIPFYVIDSLGTRHNLVLTITFTAKGEANWTITGDPTLANNSGTISFDTNGKVKNFTGGPVSFQPNGANLLTFNLNMNDITYFDRDTTVAVTKQDGLEAGVLQSFSIADGGLVQGNYSNGMIVTLGQIPLASFANPSGLEQKGSGIYAISQNSGEPMIRAVTMESSNNIVSGYLEMSNVDISEELTDMIKTQRGYQINSKVISVSDELVQDLINIKR